METNLNKMKTETYVLSLSEKLGDTKRIKTSSKMYSSERSFQLLRVFIQSLFLISQYWTLTGSYRFLARLVVKSET